MTTLETVQQLRSAEKLAADLFWAAAGPAGSKVTAEQKRLWAEKVAATKARQAAMAAFANGDR